MSTPPTDAAIVEAVESRLSRFIDARPLPRSLLDAIRYALLGGGKRVRPTLTARACLAVGGTLDQALDPACAVELIHAFSLVHDDLPAMDDDDLRRGRPTLHKHTSEAMAILAGDAMTALAFELLTESPADPATAARLVSELSSATNAMIAGQVYDTMQGHPPGLDDLEKLKLTHRNKTGALLAAAVRMGAISGGADAEQLEALTRYAQAVGLMFQAVDDLLDATQSTDAMGKQTQKDAQAGKLTYPGLLGLEGTRDEIERLRQAAAEALAGFGASAAALGSMAEQLAVRQR